jgi:hypothetical protein
MAAFDQVVAEDGVVGEAPFQAQLERIDRVDALANERAFVKHVLIHVRDHLRIRIDTRIAGIQLRIARTRRAGQADAHARLQHAVAGHHPALGRVVHRAVERVVDGADELVRRFARQLGVGVQRDDVLHRRQGVDVAHDQKKAIARAATK